MTIDNALAAALAGKCIVENQKLRARLELFDESIVLTRYQAGKPVATYEVAPDALVSAFSGVPVATGLLPRECLFFAEANGAVRLGIYLPPRVRTLMANGDVPLMTIPLPGMVFVGNGTGYSIFAVKQRPAEPSERLFHAPLPNVYPEGRICAGSVRFPACSAATIHTAAALFFASGFNSDLSRDKCHSHPGNVLALWQELTSAGEFPLDELKKTSLKLEDLYGAA
ncbi:MAG: hypothetical protein JXA21_11395 [Anaerolineae bacterium]|nr:hypothetical protein [Anaerolineae bacterium]